RPPSAAEGDSSAPGIRDVFGNFLNYRAAAAGTDFRINILKPVGDDLPSESPGLRGLTGPYVPYQEYTKPRTVPNGFNPSDRVDTRVARLYYFRDAHRVAQIINRAARSFNRAAVDIRRQLADKAQRDADRATDDRRAAERKAVAAAQATRN